MMRAYPIRLLLLLSLSTPTCNFFMRGGNRQVQDGVNPHSPGPWAQSHAPSGLTDSHTTDDEDTESRLLRTSIGCGQDCARTEEYNPVDPDVPVALTNIDRDLQEHVEEQPDDVPDILVSVSIPHSRTGRVKLASKDITKILRQESYKLLQERLTQDIANILTRLHLKNDRETVPQEATKSVSVQHQSQTRNREFLLRDERNFKSGTTSSVTGEKSFISTAKGWTPGPRTLLLGTTDNRRKASTSLHTSSSKQSDREKVIFDEAFTTKLCSDKSKHHVDLQTVFLMRELCKSVSPHGRTHPRLVSDQRWDNVTQSWRYKQFPILNPRSQDWGMKIRTDFDRTVAASRPDFSDKVEAGPYRKVSNMQEELTSFSEQPPGSEPVLDDWIELTEEGSREGNPVQQGDSSEKLLEDADASFERFTSSNGVSEEFDPSWLFTNNDPEVTDQAEEEEEVVSKRRAMDKDKKVFVYGQDDRLRVFLSQMRKFPFSNIARLSTGCTGTLVTPRHVLTAAHCVHNGLDFRSNLEMLKIEIPDTMGFRSYYAQKISVPTGWLRNVDSNSINGYQSGRHAAYDYAVVRLKLAVAGRNRFLPLAVPRADVLTLDIHFLAFPESDHGLWRSVCPASAHMARMDGNLILTRCDAAVGNSGAAVFTNEPHEGMRVVGVLSNTMHVAYHRSFDRYSIITALTWPKLADICRQLGSLAQKYNVCPPFRYMRRAPPPLRLTAIPFFGKRQQGPV